MTDFNIHNKKYRMFKADAENETNSIPTRIEAYFYACFHLIEAIAARKAIHIEKHQKVRSILERNQQIFGDNTEDVWRAFQEIENQIRPGQIYGGLIDGKKLKRTKELFGVVNNLCEGALE